MNDAPATQLQPTATLACPRCAWAWPPPGLPPLSPNARYLNPTWCRYCLDVPADSVRLEPRPELVQWVRQHLNRLTREDVTAVDIAAAVNAGRQAAVERAVDVRAMFVHAVADDAEACEWVRVNLVRAWWHDSRVLQGLRDVLAGLVPLPWHVALAHRASAKVMRCDGCNVDVPAGDGRCPKCRALLEVRS